MIRPRQQFVTEYRGHRRRHAPPTYDSARAYDPTEHQGSEERPPRDIRDDVSPIRRQAEAIFDPGSAPQPFIDDPFEPRKIEPTPEKADAFTKAEAFFKAPSPEQTPSQDQAATVPAASAPPTAQSTPSNEPTTTGVVASSPSEPSAPPRRILQAIEGPTELERRIEADNNVVRSRRGRKPGSKNKPKPAPTPDLLSVLPQTAALPPQLAPVLRPVSQPDHRVEALAPQIFSVPMDRTTSPKKIKLGERWKVRLRHLPRQKRSRVG